MYPLDGVSNQPHLHCLLLDKSFSNSLSSCQSGEATSCPWPAGVERNLQTLQAREVSVPPLEDAVGEHLLPQISADSMTTPVHCDGASASRETRAPKGERGISCPCAWWRSVMSPSQSERKEIMLAQGQQTEPQEQGWYRSGKETF